MSQRSLLATLGVLVLACSVATAQPATPEKNFSLKHTTAADTTAQARAREAARAAYVPGLKTGKLEATITLGFLDLATPFVTRPGRIIYKRTDEQTFYGNVVLQGESAFNPVVHLSCGLRPWFALEGAFGLSVSEYSSTISHTVALSNEQGNNERIEDVAVGEFDAEQRSCITLSSGLNGIFYPLSIGNDGGGRFHPFLVGGFGRTYYSLNSNYTDKAASSWTYTGGAGIRFIADKLISVRMEVLYNHSRVRFDPAEKFLSLDDGTLIIPLYELPTEGVPKVVEEFEAHDVNALSWGIGFTASF